MIENIAIKIGPEMDILFQKYKIKPWYQVHMQRYLKIVILKLVVQNHNYASNHLY